MSHLKIPDSISTCGNVAKYMYHQAARPSLCMGFGMRLQAGVPSTPVSQHTPNTGHGFPVPPSHSTLQSQGGGSQYPRLTAHSKHKAGVPSTSVSHIVCESTIPLRLTSAHTSWHYVLLRWGTLDGGSVVYRINTMDVYVKHTELMAYMYFRYQCKSA